MTNEMALALRPIVEAFETMGIVYCISGSLASSAFGIPRSTMDADLVADMSLSHAGDLVQSLGEQYYLESENISDAIARSSSFHALHLDTMMKIDVFIPNDRAFDRSLLARRIRKNSVALESSDVYFCTPEDSILTKLEWYRIGNEVSQRQWTDILGVLRIQGQSLDRSYLEHWASTLGLRDLLERALAEVGS